ncbi:ABC transporter ATP-binding protein [bacterium]|jgi:ABC-2 type transport system ATP-binding protein|nr:ABC transporter ATP-binding protein [bacterium]
MADTLISIKNLSKIYNSKEGSIKALDNISLDIHAGEIFGLLGVNGAGKTTLSTILAAFHPLTSGDILYNGISIYKDIPSYRYIVSYCPQTPNLDEELTIEQNLLFAGRYFGMPEDEVQKRTKELLDYFEFSLYAHRKQDVLSGGYARRLLFARAIMHKPKLVILDEPTVGLDPHVRHGLWDIIRMLKKQGVTVILTTHYLDEAEVLSDRICILDKGKIKLIDSPEKLKTEYKKGNLEDVFIELMKEDVLACDHEDGLPEEEENEG